MVNRVEENICPICGGRKQDASTTFTVDLNTGVVVVRNVPASICSQCGEEWIDHKTAQLLEKIAEEAREKRCQFEVVAL
jgi:YgiT-type zinc finger domain-containing protein